MRQINAAWLRSKAAQTVITMLTGSGHQAYFVGGCVRNELLNTPVVDVDIATDAVPDRVEELAELSGLKSIPTGKEHGTITVVSHGKAYEITTFRRDATTDGRRAVVAFSSLIIEDASRRDFTMNALYAGADGKVSDPLEGLPDLTAGRVRFIGDAGQRIKEDYLRILRFFRFYALYGAEEIGIDADGLAACALHADGLENLAKERIGAEMIKLLDAPNPAPACASMERVGILARILPGAASAGLAVLVHVEMQAGLSPDWLRRLAILGGEDVARSLRLSRAHADRLDILTKNFAGSVHLPELAYRQGADAATSVAVLRAATFGSELAVDLADKINAAANSVFPVNAADLMPKLQGPQLGARLKQIEADWIASGFTATKSDLLG